MPPVRAGRRECVWPALHECVAGSRRALTHGSTGLSVNSIFLGKIVCTTVFHAVKRSCQRNKAFALTVDSLDLPPPLCPDAPAPPVQLSALLNELKAMHDERDLLQQEYKAQMSKLIDECTLLRAEVQDLRERLRSSQDDHIATSKALTSLRRSASALRKSNAPCTRVALKFFRGSRIIAVIRFRQGIKNFATFMIKERDSPFSLFDFEEVVAALRRRPGFQSTLDVLQTLASCHSSKSKALGAAHILAKLVNQNANALSSELALILHLRGATDRAIGILATAGITDTPSAMRLRMDRIFKDHKKFCLTKLSAAPCRLRVVNIDDYHAGATLRFVSILMISFSNVFFLMTGDPTKPRAARSATWPPSSSP